MTRKEIQDKLRDITARTRNHQVVKEELITWLEDNSVSELELSQILNDLTGYKEYLDLVN